MRPIGSKIKTLSELKPIIQKAKKAGKKIVLGHGVFDFLHYGHMYYLWQAKRMGNILVVSVISDYFVRKGTGRPVFNTKTRVGSLAFLECVDYVVPCKEEGPYKIIRELKPSIYAKGEDSIQQLKRSKSGLNKDKLLIEAVGGTLVFTKSLPIHSTELLRKFSSK